MLHALLQTRARPGVAPRPVSPCARCRGKRPVLLDACTIRGPLNRKRASLLLVPVVHLLAPADLARAAGRDETHLLTRHLHERRSKTRPSASGAREAVRSWRQRPASKQTRRSERRERIRKRRRRTESRRTVDGWPMCWWLPPPCGCSTGFIATPRTFGQLLRLTRYLWKARPAFSSGLSMRPPPATMPTAARAPEFTSFFCPEGRRRRVLPTPSMWPTICAKPPDVRANFERSPGIFSTWLTTVPGGMASSGRMLPGTSWAARRD